MEVTHARQHGVYSYHYWFVADKDKHTHCRTQKHKFPSHQMGTPDVFHLVSNLTEVTKDVI